MKNRLQLNWELPTAKERIEFLSRYMEGLPFEPSPAELETCAAYVLWGFDEDGKNGEQKGQYDLGRKRKSWTQKEPTSLDELVSTTGESEILPKSYVPTKVTREVFSREKPDETLRPTYSSSSKPSGPKSIFWTSRFVNTSKDLESEKPHPAQNFWQGLHPPKSKPPTKSPSYSQASPT